MRNWGKYYTEFNDRHVLSRLFVIPRVGPMDLTLEEFAKWAAPLVQYAVLRQDTEIPVFYVMIGKHRRLVSRGYGFDLLWNMPTRVIFNGKLYDGLCEFCTDRLSGLVGVCDRCKFDSDVPLDSQLIRVARFDRALEELGFKKVPKSVVIPRKLSYYLAYCQQVDFNPIVVEENLAEVKAVADLAKRTRQIKNEWCSDCVFFRHDGRTCTRGWYPLNCRDGRITMRATSQEEVRDRLLADLEKRTGYGPDRLAEWVYRHLITGDYQQVKWPEGSRRAALQGLVMVGRDGYLIRRRWPCNAAPSVISFSDAERLFGEPSLSLDEVRSLPNLKELAAMLWGTYLSIYGNPWLDTRTWVKTPLYHYKYYLLGIQVVYLRDWSVKILYNYDSRDRDYYVTELLRVGEVPEKPNNN